MPSEQTQVAYQTVVPYLIIPDADALIRFAAQAFGAQEIQRHNTADGKIMHAEVRIGDSVIMMADSSDEHPPMPTSLYLNVEEVDATYTRAIEAGATSLREPEEQPYGRSAGVRDSNGNRWWITASSQAS